MKPRSFTDCDSSFSSAQIPEPKSRKNKVWRLPRAMFVFDTETRTDASQRLTFGSYRFFVDNELVEEALFYADDLPSKDRRTLEKYVASHKPGEPSPFVNSQRIPQEAVQNGLQRPCSLGRVSIYRSIYLELRSPHGQREEGLRAVSRCAIWSYIKAWGGKTFDPSPERMVSSTSIPNGP